MRDLARTIRLLRNHVGVLLLVSPWMSTACAPTVVPVREPRKACEAQQVSMSIVASDTINPSAQGESRPVVVRVYQLREAIGLNNATFEQVWRDEKEALGGDIVMRGEAYAYPNTRTEIAFQRNPDANAVAIAALYRGHQGKSWFITFDLPPAPGKGDCRTADCEDGSCGVDANPAFAVWLDGTRVEQGSQHLQDVTDVRRVRVVQLGKSAGEAPPPPAASNP